MKKKSVKKGLSASALKELWHLARTVPERARQEIRPLLHKPSNWDNVLDYNRGMRIGYGKPNVPHAKPSFNTERGSFYQGLYETNNPSRTGYRRFKFNGETNEPLEITSFIPEYDDARRWGLTGRDEQTYTRDLQRIMTNSNPGLTNPDVPDGAFYGFMNGGGKGTSPKSAQWNNTFDIEDFNDADFHQVEGGWRDRKTKVAFPKQNRYGIPPVRMPVVKYPIIGGHLVESTFNTSRGAPRARHFGHQVTEFLNPTMPTVKKRQLKKNGFVNKMTRTPQVIGKHMSKSMTTKKTKTVNNKYFD